MPEPILDDVEDTPPTTEVPTVGSIDDIVGSFDFSSPPPSQTPSTDSIDIPINNSSLDELEAEIDNSALVGKTQESINSFEGLKARYKNKISEFKTQLESLKREKEELSQQTSKVSELEAKVRAYDDMVSRNKFLEEEAEQAKADAEKNAYYRRKYDFENDPEVRKAYVAPMNDLKTKCLDIIDNAGLDDNVWHDLIHADSEYKINSIIDAADISGMNAQSLKSYVGQYKALGAEFSKASNPEYIDSALQAARGKGQRLSDEVANKSFTDIKDAFAKHVKEIQYSDVNKEHNLFVHDKVVENAKGIFESLRKTMSSEYQNPQSMASVAQAAIMASAYPFQKKLVDYLMKDRAELLKGLKESTSGPSIKQSTESSDYLSSTSTDFINNTLTKSVDDIANEVFRSL